MLYKKQKQEQQHMAITAKQQDREGRKVEDIKIFNYYSPSERDIIPSE